MTTPCRLADPDRDGTLFLSDLANAPDPPPLPGAALRPATSADVLALQEALHASGEYLDDVVAARQQHNRHPYVVEADGKIVSYGWVAYSAEPLGDLGISFQLRPDEAYIYDCATRPDYRGRGYYPVLLRFMCAELRRAGRRRAWIGTAPGNFVSQRSIARAGFMKVADVNFTRRPDGSFRVDLYGARGAPPDALDAAAWSFHGRPHPGAGIP
jgi:GNAT superfamily N-acetyltransferase